MNITTKLIPEEDEFGNIVYCLKRFYYFDDNLFNNIKEYLFYRKKRQKAVLQLKFNGKFKIINQLQYGLFIKDNKRNYTQKELIKITPNVFNIEFPTNNLFVEIIREYNDVIICDIFKPEKAREKKIFLSKIINIQIDAEPIITIAERDFYCYKRTEEKLGTIYVNKEDKYLFYKYCNNNSSYFEEVGIKTGEFTQEQIREKYGVDVLNNVLRDDYTEVLFIELGL